MGNKVEKFWLTARDVRTLCSMLDDCKGEVSDNTLIIIENERSIYDNNIFHKTMKFVTDNLKRKLMHFYNYDIRDIKPSIELPNQ